MRLPKFLKALVGCTDTESSRYALGGVNVEHGANVSILTVTDGRQLVNVSYYDEDKDGPCPVNAIVDGKTLAKAFGSVNKAKADTLLSIADGPDGKPTAFVRSRGGDTQMAPLVDGRFPRWRDVFNAEGEFSVCLSAELLRQVLGVFDAAGADNVRFWIKDRQSGVHLSGFAPTGECIRAVVMPKAADDGKYGDTQAFPVGHDIPTTTDATEAA